MKPEKKHTGRLTESKVSKNPFALFSRWFHEASKAGFIDPTAMVLATAGKNAVPSARMVLLKHHDENGFIFYTNYESRKGLELAENPHASLLFYWDKLDKQVRIEGTVEKVSKMESEEYFKTRALKSRVGAWASHQSSVIKSRSVIISNFLKFLAKFRADVPLPPYWGGYRLKPYEFEFWQGRPNRLHDRLRYRTDGDKWKIERLAP